MSEKDTKPNQSADTSPTTHTPPSAETEEEDPKLKRLREEWESQIDVVG